MKLLTRSMMAVVLCVSAGAWSGAHSQQPPAVSSRGNIAIRGTSTVGDWSCGGAAAVELVPDGTSRPVVPGFPEGVGALTAVVSVRAIECEKGGKMNDHLRKALKEKEHPEIRYELKHYASTDGTISVSGTLTIAGVTRAADLDPKLTQFPDGSVKIAGDAAITMSDFGVKPPTLLFGALKVDDDVRVEFEVSFSGLQGGAEGN